MTHTTAEQIYYDAGDGIAVTSSRVVISGTTYALRNIVSVRMFEVPIDRTAELIAISAGAVLAIFGIGGAISEMQSYSNNASPTGGFVLAMVGVIVAVIGWASLKTKAARRNYAVRISTSSGETDAFTHRDKAYVQRIVSAVAEAIGDR